MNSTELQGYIEGARRRQQQKQLLLQERYVLLLEVAQRGANILKQDCGAARVWLFGSALALNRTHLKSDVDLAVEGLDGAKYWQAIAKLLNLHGDVLVDLVMMEDAPDSLRDRILSEGKEL